MNRIPHLCAVLLAVFAFAGCKNGNGVGAANTPAGCKDGQVIDGHGNCITTCTSTADCNDTSKQCDQATGLCIPVTHQCSTNSDCDPSKVCNSFGECVAPTVYKCTKDADCPNSNMTCGSDGTCKAVSCDPSTCQPGFQCPTDGSVDCVPMPGHCGSTSDCAFGERCDASGTCVSLAGSVVQTCTTAADCGPLMTCQAGVCLGCLDSLQCGSGWQCVSGACVTADLGPAQCLLVHCSSGERCNPATGSCQATCSSSADCGANQTCVPGVGMCVNYTPCQPGAGDCPGSSTCVLGVCAGCSTAADCPSGQTCVAGAACLPDLSTAADPCSSVTCASGQSCDPRDGSCYPSDGTCSSDNDCRAGYTCNFLGLCAGCSVDSDCRPQQRCILGTCAPIG